MPARCPALPLPSAPPALPALRALLTAGALLLGGAAAQADSHALLMWAGNYGSPQLNLPNTAEDGRNAQLIARRMGIPLVRTQVLDEGRLTQLGIQQQLQRLAQQTNPGDRVFIYFSGHGAQVDGARFGTRCVEGLVTPSGDLYLDIAVQQALEQLAARGVLVVMMNDACHAGGAATKAFSWDDDGAVPKVYPAEVKGVFGLPAGKDDGGCGQVVNKGFNPRAMGLPAAPAGRWVHLAAAASNEAAWASKAGSHATQGWLACLSDPALRADADGDGQISGAELQRCAQAQVDQRFKRRQTLSTEGDATLVVAPAPSPRR